VTRLRPPRRRRRAHHELRVEVDLLRRHPRPAVDVPQQQLGRQPPHLVRGHAHRGERHRQVLEQRDVVVAHHRHVARDREPELGERAADAERDEVVEARHGRGPGVGRDAAEVGERRLVAVLEVRAGRDHVVVGERHARRAARPPQPVDALVGLGGAGRAAEVDDARVALGDEMLAGGARRREVVDAHEARRHAADAAEQHERHLPPLQLEEVRQVGLLVEHRRDDEPGHVARPEPGGEQRHGAPLRLGVALRARHEQRVAVRVGVLAHPGDHAGEVRVVELLDEHADAAPAPGAERAAAGDRRAARRPVGERLDGVEHAQAQLGAHRARVVEHGRDGGLGDVGRAGDVVDGGAGPGHGAEGTGGRRAQPRTR